MVISLKRVKEKQKTIEKSFEFEGVSLLSGQSALMMCDPAPENSGISFVIKRKTIPALIEYIKPTNIHTTVLSRDGIDIITIEHLMAAIWGLGIDNLKITLGSNVVPAKDGSAEAYVETLQKAGIVEQKDNRKMIFVEEKAILKQPEFENRFARFEVDKDKLSFCCTAPFPPPINSHTINFIDEAEAFTKNIAWARTFLRSSLDLNDSTKWNEIRTVFKALPENPRKSPIITYTETEFLTPLKKQDEPARHKLLDLIGDLALVGFRIRGRCVINEPGHKFTHLIAKEIRQALKIKKDA